MTHSNDTPTPPARPRTPAPGGTAVPGREVWEVREIDVLLSSYDVRDDGLIPLHVLGPPLGAPAALRTPDPERLRAQLRAHHGVVQWEPGRNLLRLRRGTGRATLIHLDLALPAGEDHRFVG
ncbi:hypothetical protein [Streptomyces sp. NPDC058308]|uniref:hypothetical protein n=1 Tax=Streptomyces sp. NPDC058308 TaxID=3346440 RepID=UPI0036E35EBE